MQFLEALWKGDISPGEQRYRSNQEYSEMFRIMEKCEEHLKKVLSENDLLVFRKFADTQQEVGFLSDCDHFMDGFRMGAKMMMDVLLEPK